MDLGLTDEQRAFQHEVRDWLSASVPPAPLPEPHTADGLAAHRAWERRLHDAGLASVGWPVEHGGRGLDVMTTSVFHAEYQRARAPERLQPAGLTLLGPVLMEAGTAQQQDRWLRRILTCEDLWCQGFSEPEAGSDLASLTTRGECDGDTIVVNGQKTWTSRAATADFMFALIRTNPAAPRHRGITFVVIPMRQPGVMVRPITQLNNVPGFAEVFFNDAVVPAGHVIGEVDDGWSVAMATLGHERGGNGNHTPAHFTHMLAELIDLVRTAGRAADPLLRQRIATLYEDVQAYRWMTMRTLTEALEGRPRGRQASMGKLWWSQLQVRLHELGLDVIDDDPERFDPARRTAWRRRYWHARAACIYAGTNEIQRTIIAERGLGLPKESARAV